MVTFAPNISWLFADRTIAERLALTAEAGFDACEFGFYGQVDLDVIDEARHTYGLRVVLFNMDVPDWGPGQRGVLADPAQQDVFKRAFDAALSVAERLDAEKLMLPVGARLDALPREAQTAAVIENLRYAAPLARQAGVMLTIEALNPCDVPDYFLTNSTQALDIVRRVNHPVVRFQYDTYHLQVVEGNLIHTLRENIDAIGHIQFGDAPGRTEPGYGELNFDTITHAAMTAGYEGHIGLEYIPVSTGLATVAWVHPDYKGQLAVKS